MPLITTVYESNKNSGIEKNFFSHGFSRSYNTESTETLSSQCPSHIPEKDIHGLLSVSCARIREIPRRHSSAIEIP
jgi:hypothetical protein